MLAALLHIHVPVLTLCVSWFAIAIGISYIYRVTIERFDHRSQRDRRDFLPTGMWTPRRL